nr:hypothetical protein [Streptomyces sp. SPMA113]
MLAVAVLEAGVPHRLRCPLQQDAELPGLLLELLGGLDQGASDEGGALGEEVEDLETAEVQQAVVEMGAVGAELPGGLRGPLLEGVREGAVPQAHRLDVAHADMAQGQQGHRQRVGDGPALVLGDGSLVGIAGDRALDQLLDQFADTVLGQGPLLPCQATRPEIRTGWCTSSAPGAGWANSLRISGPAAAAAARTPTPMAPGSIPHRSQR